MLMKKVDAETSMVSMMSGKARLDFTGCFNLPATFLRYKEKKLLGLKHIAFRGKPAAVVWALVF